MARRKIEDAPLPGDEPTPAKSWSKDAASDEPTPEASDPAEFERGFKAGRGVGKNDAKYDTLYGTALYGESARESLNERERVTLVLERWQIDHILYGVAVRLRDHENAAASLHPGALPAAQRGSKALSAIMADITTQIGDATAEELPALARVTTIPQIP